jgi:competence protein ComEA
MNLSLKSRVSPVWLPIVLVVCAATLIVVKVAVVDAPPVNSVLITSSPRSSPSPVAQATLSRVTHATGTATSVASVPKEKALVLAQETGITAADLPPTATQTAVAATPTPELMTVYVSGAVTHPGVYTLPVGSRIAEALGAAGGPGEEANLDAINLAARLSDEEHIHVPRIGDTPVPSGGKPTRTSATRRTPTHLATGTPRPTTSSGGATSQPELAGRVNINTAGAKELEALPGIGPSLAARIVSYREANGLFQTPEDLMRVPGIKEGLFAKVKDYITVGP